MDGSVGTIGLEPNSEGLLSSFVAVKLELGQCSWRAFWAGWKARYPGSECTVVLEETCCADRKSFETIDEAIIDAWMAHMIDVIAGSDRLKTIE